MIADSQKYKKGGKGKSQGKSINKKSKSKKKGESRHKETLHSPISQKKLPTESMKHQIPTSRSKSKHKKKQSGCKIVSDFQHEKSKEKYSNRT